MPMIYSDRLNFTSINLPTPFNEMCEGAPLRGSFCDTAGLGSALTGSGWTAKDLSSTITADGGSGLLDGFKVGVFTGRVLPAGGLPAATGLRMPTTPSIEFDKDQYIHVLYHRGDRPVLEYGTYNHASSYYW